MRSVDPTLLQGRSACAIVAQSSNVAPEFLLGENRGSSIVVARWRRRHVRLAEPVLLTEHVLSYCAGGSAACTIVAGGVRRDHLQQTSSLTFLHADQAVQWSLDADEDIVHVHVYLASEAVARLARDYPLLEQPPRLPNFIAVRDAWLEGWFGLLLSEYELCGRNGRLDDSLFLDQTEDLLIARLLFNPPAAAEAAGDSAGRRRVSPLRPSLVGRINDYVLKNLAGEIRLQQLAALAGLSVDHFLRAFREATGVTPHRYLLELRLNRARDLLRGDSVPIARVARDCGFANPARFSVAFRARFGMTPTQYRGRQ